MTPEQIATELRRLSDQAREMAKAGAPTPEERRRLKELTREEFLKLVEDLA